MHVTAKPLQATMSSLRTEFSGHFQQHQVTTAGYVFFTGIKLHKLDVTDMKLCIIILWFTFGFGLIFCVSFGLDYDNL